MLTRQQCFLALCYVRFPGAESAESLTTHDYIKSLLRELTYEAPGGRGQDNMDVLCAMWQVLRSYKGQGRLDGSTGACPALEKERKCLTCLLGEGHGPVLGTNAPGA